MDRAVTANTLLLPYHWLRDDLDTFDVIHEPPLATLVAVRFLAADFPLCLPPFLDTILCPHACLPTDNNAPNCYSVRVIDHSRSATQYAVLLDLAPDRPPMYPWQFTTINAPQQYDCMQRLEHCHWRSSRATYAPLRFNPGKWHAACTYHLAAFNARLATAHNPSGANPTLCAFVVLQHHPIPRSPPIVPTYGTTQTTPDHTTALPPFPACATCLATPHYTATHLRHTCPLVFAIYRRLEMTDDIVMPALLMTVLVVVVMATVGRRWTVGG